MYLIYFETKFVQAASTAVWKTLDSQILAENEGNGKRPVLSVSIGS